MPRQPSEYSPLSYVPAALYALFVAVMIVLFPESVFQASLEGLSMWWKIVFPALLPFLIFSHLLFTFGVIERLGRWLEPFMQTVFRLPGAGGWALAAGLSAGAPAGAAIVTNLLQDQLLSRDEADRLLALCHAVNPVIVIHVIAFGFFGDIRLGWFLLAVHWLSLLLTGFIYSRGRGKVKTVPRSRTIAGPGPISLGKQLGDAVADATMTTMKVGGTIIMFAVLIKTAEIAVISLLAQPAHPFLDQGLSASLSAVLEIHLGAYRISEWNVFSPAMVTVFLSAMIGWGGLSSHLQVQSVVRGPMRYGRFVQFRLVHAVIAVMISFIGWNIWLAERSAPSSIVLPTVSADRYFPLPLGWGWLFALAAALLLLFLFVSVIIACLRRITRRL